MTRPTNQELWELLDNATPRPWQALPMRGATITGAPVILRIAVTSSDGDKPDWTVMAGIQEDEPLRPENNARLIAAAVMSLPDLLNENDLLRDKVRVLQRVVAAAREHQCQLCREGVPRVDVHNNSPQDYHLYSYNPCTSVELTRALDALDRFEENER